MEQTKRQASNSFNDYDNNKRNKIQITTDETTDLSTETISQFEDLSNELIYDVFEFLNHFHVYEAFLNLNQRFYHLVHNSNVPININFSNVSKSAFEHYNNDIIKHNKHRISSLRFPDLFSYNFIITSLCKLSEFSRLRALILYNIESNYLASLLGQLLSLSLLSSLIITNLDRMQHKSMIYDKILRLPALKYCKLSFEGWNIDGSLPTATNQYSPIEHLIITNHVHLNELYNILSYVPHLRRLSLESLSSYRYASSQLSPFLLNCLTHASIKMSSKEFDTFEHLVINTFHSVEVLRFTSYSYSSQEYMDAKRWEQLIVLRIPNLRIFDIQFDMYINNETDKLRSEVEIDHFISPFWIERQWFFAHQFYQQKNSNHLIFYSTFPYRRKNYTLYKHKGENGNLHHYQSNLNSVQQVHIQSKESAIKCTKYFQNTTELILEDKFSVTHPSVTTILDGIIPLKRLTKLIVQCGGFSVQKIIQILCCSPNIHTLELQSIACYQRNNDFTSIRDSDDFQEVSNTNIIKNITCKTKLTLEQIKLLVALCPRTQYLTVNGFIDDLESIIRFLLDKTNNHTRHLCAFCFSAVSQNRFKKFDTLIKSEALLDDYILKIIERKLYLWW